MTESAPVICLTEGCLIATPGGETLIEDLEVGQLVETLSNGAQPIRMIYSRTLSGVDYRDDRRLWPVRIGQGALGFGLPRRDLWVSPQHRMVFRHIRIPLMFGEEAVFVKAKSLCAAFDNVRVDASRRAVTYFHLVFDRHEILFAEGAATESFHPGPAGIAALDPEAREELFAIFPELAVGGTRTEADLITLKSWELMSAVA